MAVKILRVGGHEIGLENPEKVLFPDDRITKEDLARYYGRVARFMLPHIKDRPLTLNRFPDGIKSEGFFQKEAPAYFPAYIKRSGQKKEGGTTNYAIADNAAALVYLVGQASITLHVWLSREDKPEYPDMMIFDLDPPDNDFEPVRHTAFALRDLFKESYVATFVKTTGSRGLHVTVPLDRSAAFGEVRSFARDIARFCAARDPQRLTVEERKEKRGNRLFLDTLRNSYAQTVVAPYSVRAIPNAPVAAPLDWEELGDRMVTSRRYNISNILERLEKKGDPWRNLWHKTYALADMKMSFGAMK